MMRHVRQRQPGAETRDYVNRKEGRQRKIRVGEKEEKGAE